MEIELKDLVGLRMLSGVDINIQSFADEDEGCVDSEVIAFALDDQTYTAIADPQDGYRSCMREIIVGSLPIQNRFPPQQVLGIWRTERGSYSCDVIEFYDTSTALLVLAIGTDSLDDYYPTWVCEWTPENMALNTGK